MVPPHPTATAIFYATFSDAGATRTFSVTGGDVHLYFDTTPDYDFVPDIGFTDDTPLLWGSILAGGGGVINLSRGSGYTDVDLTFAGGLNGFDHAVYNPATIGGGNAYFVISSAGVAGLTNVNKVLGQTMGATDGIFSASGELRLTAVPLPAAVWLFGAGFMGLLAIGKRKKFSA